VDTGPASIQGAGLRVTVVQQHSVGADGGSTVELLTYVRF
jgi:hypothetical protein